MFCPKCKCEYIEGISECSDCNVALITELTPETHPGYVEYEAVMSTFNPADIVIIRSILDSEKITYYFQGEHFSQVQPFIEPAILMVSKDQVETVKEILKDIELVYTGVSLDESNEYETEDIVNDEADEDID